MTIEKFIESAIKGGWKSNIIDINVQWRNAILDPLAWSAVEKVEGWNICKRCKRENLCAHYKKDWKDRMHQMIDALIEGKTIEEYIKTL